MVVDPSLSLTENSFEGPKIYPNPVAHWLTINLGDQNNFKLQIHDLTGKLILKQELLGNINAIDVSTFQSGMYLLTIESENQSVTKQIIKQ